MELVELGAVTGGEERGVMANQPGSWEVLKRELERRLAAREPVYTLVQRVPNDVLEVGNDYVVVKSHRGRQARTIFNHEIFDPDVESHIGKRRIILALRDLA